MKHEYGYIVSVISDGFLLNYERHAELTRTYTLLYMRSTRVHIRSHTPGPLFARMARKVVQCCIANCITCTHIAHIAYRSLALSPSTFHSDIPSLFLSHSFFVVRSFLSTSLLLTLIFLDRSSYVILHFRCYAHFLCDFSTFLLFSNLRGFTCVDFPSSFKNLHL